MWFGTNSGLNRYDGYKFRVFKHNAMDPQSLIGNYICNIYEGPDKKMWVYTHSGFSVYDANTEKFSSDNPGVLLRYGVNTNKLTGIKKDVAGRYWFLTQGDGIYCYDPSTKQTAYYNTLYKSKIVLHANFAADVVGADQTSVWVVYHDGIIEKIDTKLNRVVAQTNVLNVAMKGKPTNYTAIKSTSGNLWIHVGDSFNGAYCYEPVTGKLSHYDKDSPSMRLNSNVIYSIVQGDDGNVWIGTDHGGINVVNEKTHQITYLLNRDDDNESLRGNCVVLYRDDTGIVWAGTYKQGISYYHKDIIQFSLIRHYDSNPQSLPYEDVNSFVEDDKGNIWIGTNGGGLIYYDLSTKKFTQYKHDDHDPHSLSNNIIVGMYIDRRKQLWVGTYFGGLERFDGTGFIHYRHKDNDPTTISDDRVYCFTEDADHNLWVGTFAGSLNVLNPKTNKFSHPQYRMISAYTSIMLTDRKNNIWIGRDKGIDVIDPAKHAVRHYQNIPGDPNSLVANDVNCIKQDHNGLIWIGTKDGLSVFNPETGKFTNLDEKGGLPNSNTWCILEDELGQMWLSSAGGIACVKLVNTPAGYHFDIKKYDEFDGLQGREYNNYASLRMRNGDMLFGGGHGVNMFNPDRIHNVKLKPGLLLTDFQLFNKSIAVGEKVNKDVLLPQSITNTKSMVLKHDENVFSIEFAACDYFNVNRITYQYKLDGFDQQWLTSPKDSHKATYTNLDAGDYTFRVRATNANDPGNSSMVTMNIKILPPFWKSNSAYGLYFVLAVGLLFYIRHRGITKLRREFAQQQEKQDAERRITREREEAKRIHELDLIKIKFFTNVSHEFRTPLSLIISPIDNLIKNNQQPEQQQQLMLIKRNGKRLLNLVNQLLDFRKMEFNELKLNIRNGDMVKFVREVSNSFADMAEQNQIGFLFDSDISALHIKFDQDKIERVLFNLLSNAFKFTAHGGHISVFMTLVKCDKADTDEQILEIKVMDNGIGIPAEKHEKIFERFFQDAVPEAILNQGSGIGLAISREFIRMHNGDISVESEPGNGSCFIIRMPVEVQSVKANAGQPVGNGVVKAAENSLDASRKPVILLVEDNDDLRFYLKDNLKQSFNIVEAANGKDGWQKALALHPQLIVSDINMPEMNGIDLCNKIRNDERTAHIPVILLTAITETESQLAGTSSGANDYITKPFNFEILLSKINGLLQMQQTLKRTYQKQKDIEVKDMEIVSEDQKFLQNALACIEKNITNPNFSVEELSRQMSLSRVSLYKRLLALTGKTPVECIRTIRLKKAVQLLEKSQLSIASVAYEVGFNNPTYFSKIFKDEYGTLPSEYVNEIRKKGSKPLEIVSEF